MATAHLSVLSLDTVGFRWIMDTTTSTMTMTATMKNDDHDYDENGNEDDNGDDDKRAIVLVSQSVCQSFVKFNVN